MKKVMLLIDIFFPSYFEEFCNYILLTNQWVQVFMQYSNGLFSCISY